MEHTDADGTPIIDEPVLSLRRLYHATRMWAWFIILGSERLSLWQHVLRYRRQYRNYVKRISY